MFTRGQEPWLAECRMQFSSCSATPAPTFGRNLDKQTQQLGEKGEGREHDVCSLGTVSFLSRSLMESEARRMFTRGTSQGASVQNGHSRGLLPRGCQSRRGSGWGDNGRPGSWPFMFQRRGEQERDRSSDLRGVLGGCLLHLVLKETGADP